MNCGGRSQWEGMTYFVSAQVLHRVDIGNVELISRNERIDPLHGRLEVPIVVKSIEGRRLGRTSLEARLHIPAYPPINEPRTTSTHLEIEGIWTAVDYGQSRISRRDHNNNTRDVRRKSIVDLSDVQSTKSWG